MIFDIFFASMRGKSSVTQTTTRRAPEFNEHGDAILAELDYDEDKVVHSKISGSLAWRSLRETREETCSSKT